MDGSRYRELAKRAADLYERLLRDPSLMLGEQEGVRHNLALLRG